MARTVSGKVGGGELDLDFEGFEGDTCSREEETIRLLLGAMGVGNVVTHSDNDNTEKEKERIKVR